MSSRELELGLRECAGDCRAFQGTSNKSMKFLIDTADDIIESNSKYEIEELAQYIPDIEKYLTEIAGLQYEVDNVTKAMDHVTSALSQERENNSETISEYFRSCLKDLTEQNVSDINNHPLVKEFQELVSQREPEEERMEGDEELAVGQVQRSLLCPFTRKIFEEPVKNKRCGHIYSKQAAITHIGVRPIGRAKCPVGGCPELLLQEELEHDEDTERAVRRMLRQRKQ